MGAQPWRCSRTLTLRSKRSTLVATSEREIVRVLYDDGAHVNPYWGYLSRAGIEDKSHLMRQIEKYADIYTSRVSNFLGYTPDVHFRAGRQSLAHDAEFYRLSEDSSLE